MSGHTPEAYARLEHPPVPDSRDERFRQTAWDKAPTRLAQGPSRARGTFGMFSGADARSEMNHVAGKFARVVMGMDNTYSHNRLAPNAGTDIPMAHAIGREIIRAGLADHAHIERATTGFDEYRQLVEPWTPSLAEKVTGVPASAIRELAHAYARDERARLCWAPGGTEHHNGTKHHNGTDTAGAVSNLSLLTGHEHGPSPTERVSPGGRDPRTPFRLVRHDPPVDLTDERYPIRLTTGRRLDSYGTGAQSGSSASPLRRGECVELCPEDAEHYGVVVGEKVQVRSRRGSMVVPVWVDTALPPGLAFTTLHFSDEADIEPPTIEVNCPIVGAEEFKASAIRIEKLPVAAVRS
ncbi:hypothetical protein GCM10011579_081110 [Streptomyces albiflavescens]|uniref:Molybdopterin dinucleotide-binding domain-containing protein n=1 Tax=Streptomyces albiflavescens TaxID=1623582 RepID=A0A918D946_9ACTN|nr:molybdopterin dinucleotide binding domain-containing protein [Streptomyces albiflavescens]GGN87836.1 hypothetical protein GCM10011579_081110 [Streptomyces albiflavescens]